MWKDIVSNIIEITKEEIIDLYDSEIKNHASTIDNAAQKAFDKLLKHYSIDAETQKALILMLTDGANDFNIDALNLPERSVVAAKLNSMDVIGKINNFRKIYKIGEHLQKTYTSFKEANQHIKKDADGNITGWDLEGKQKLAENVENVINVITDIIGDIPCSEYYTEFLNGIVDGIMYITPLILEEEEKKIAYDMVNIFSKDNGICSFSYETFKKSILNIA